MKQKKFKKAASAAKLAKFLGMKVTRGKATTLKDGSKANYYIFTKKKGKK